MSKQSMEPIPVASAVLLISLGGFPIINEEDVQEFIDALVKNNLIVEEPFNDVPYIYTNPSNEPMTFGVFFKDKNKNEYITFKANSMGIANWAPIKHIWESKLNKENKSGESELKLDKSGFLATRSGQCG